MSVKQIGKYALYNCLIEKKEGIMKESSNHTLITSEEELKQIEEWSQTKFKEIIFDSEIDSWSQNNSVFHRNILNKRNIVFLFEDTENNLFGCFHSQMISHLIQIEYNQLTGTSNQDIYSFLFSLRSNGRLETPTKFPHQTEYIRFGLHLFNEHCEELILIGGGNDICIKKENFKHECHCYQFSFDYHGRRKFLLEKKEASIHSH